MNIESHDKTLCLRNFAKIIIKNMKRKIYIKKDFLSPHDLDIDEKDGKAQINVYKLLFNSLTYSIEELKDSNISDKKNISLFQNGKANFPAETIAIIQKEKNIKYIVDKVAIYFARNLIPNIADLKDCVGGIHELVQSDEKISKIKRKELNEVYNENTEAYYLAKIFCKAIGGENKIPENKQKNSTSLRTVKKELRDSMKNYIDSFIEVFKSFDNLPAFVKRESEKQEEICLCNMLDNEKSHVYLYGDGGIGKTTSLMKYVQGKLSKKDVVKKGKTQQKDEVSKDDPRVFILIKLNEYEYYNSNDNLFLIKYVEKFINFAYRFETINDEFKRNNNDSPEYILILDGINEISFDLKSRLMNELNDYIKKDSEYKNTRIILTGRNKNNYDGNDNLKKYELQPITEETITKYLKGKEYTDDRIKKIKSNIPLLECIKLPFYLCKFADIGKFSENNHISSRCEILTAYYDREINKYQDNEKKYILEFILRYIIPQIAYNMEKNCKREISEKDLTEIIKNLLASANKHEYRRNRSRSSRGVFRDIKPEQILDILLDEIYIINERDINIATCQYEFVHDNTRDYFTAAYIINTMKFASQYYETNLFQESLKCIEEINISLWDEEKIRFINEFLNKGTFDLNSIMSMYKNSIFDKNEKIINVGIKNILECAKLSGNLKSIDFSFLDLRNINLSGYDLENINFENSKISRNTLIPQGSIKTARNIALAEKIGVCFTRSRDDCILKYNIENQDTEHILIKNFDKTGYHIACSSDGEICFVSDDKENIWTITFDKDNGYSESRIIKSKNILKKYKNNCKLINIISSDDGKNFYVLYNHSETNSLILHMQKNKNNKYIIDKYIPYQFDIKINCFCLFKNELYLGAENGRLYKNANGSLNEITIFNNTKNEDFISINCIYPSNEHIFIGRGDNDIIKYAVVSGTWIKYIIPKEDKSKRLPLKKIFCTKDGENFGGYFNGQKYFIVYDKEYNIIKKVEDKDADVIISCMEYYNNPINNNKNRYIICRRDNNIYLKNSNNYLVHKLGGGNRLICEVYYSEKEKVLICACRDGSIRKFDVEKGKIVKNKLNSHESFIEALAYISNKELFITGSYDKTIKLWNKNLKEISNNFENNHKGNIKSIVCSNDGEIIYSAGVLEDLGFINNIAKGKGQFFKWEKEENIDGKYSSKEININGGKIGIINSLACSSDGKICFLGSGDFNVYKYDSEDEYLSFLYDDNGYINEVACSSDGKICYSVSFFPGTDKFGNKGCLYKWDSKSCEKIEIFKYKSDTDGLVCVTCNTAGDICYIGTSDGIIYLYKDHKINIDMNIKTESNIKKLKCYDDGKTLFVSYDNKILKYTLNEDNNLENSGEWDIIENINIMNCDFSKSLIEDDEELLNIIKTNGGIINV